MLECWSSDPSKRPDFSELASTLDSNLESVAGYMEVQMNLIPADREGRDEIMDPTEVEPEVSHEDALTGEGVMQHQIDVHLKVT